MANLLIASALISALLLILAESVSVRFTYKNELKIDIDYLLFNLILYPTRNRSPAKRKLKKGFVERLKSSFRRAFATRRALEFLFKHSRLTVHEINIPLSDTEPSRFILNSQNILSVISMLMAYLSLKSETLTTEDNILISTEQDRLKNLPTLELTVKTTLLTTLLSFIIFGIENRKKRGKQREKNGRNKNERYYKDLT